MIISKTERTLSMREFVYKLTDENGLHARPAGLFVKAASQFSSEITVSTENKSANGKKIFSVMQLGAKCGDLLKVQIDGSDEEVAAASLEKFLKENL